LSNFVYATERQVQKLQETHTPVTLKKKKPVHHSTTNTKKKILLNLTTNDPPLIFPGQQVMIWNTFGFRVLQLRFPMLPSINRQYESGKRFHTRKAYKDLKKEVRKVIEPLIAASGWTTTKEDRYLIVLDFCFANEVKQDLDGPIKATADALQRQNPEREDKIELVTSEAIAAWKAAHPGEKLTPEAKAKLATKEAIEAWKESHPYAIWNDGQNMQIILVKHINQKELTATVTIYAFEKKEYIAVPIHQLLLNYLLEKKGLPSWPST
jgi:hypothetical protein